MSDICDVGREVKVPKMLVEDIKKYCLSKHKIYEDCPFGDVPICYKLNGKVFAQIYPCPEDYKITLKCTADAGQFYRMVYPGKVVRGYHCPTVQQPYWNTIYLGDFPDDELIPLFTLAIRLVTDTEIRTTRLKEREKQKFGDRIMPGGDMYTHHMEFIEWARKYDTGSVNMRSKAKHDEWQKLLMCKQIVINGADDLGENFKKVQEKMNSVIGRTVTVTVDRPLGSYHPEHEDMYYPINYGYVEGIMAPDGEEQDAYILGVDEAVEKFTGTVIAVVHRNDDVEEKWVVVPEGMTFTKEEIMKQIYFQEQYFDSKIMV